MRALFGLMFLSCFFVACTATLPNKSLQEKRSVEVEKSESTRFESSVEVVADAAVVEEPFSETFEQTHSSEPTVDIAPERLSEPVVEEGGRELSPEKNQDPYVAPFEPSWSSQKCPFVGVPKFGTKVGDMLDTLVVKDCNGGEVDVRAFCGAKAVWLSFHHGWCPHCRALRDMMEKFQTKYAKGGLVVISILVESSSRTAPTKDHCRAWRRDGSHVRSFTLYDPTFISRKYWEQNYTALNIFLNANRVITAKVHSDTESQLDNEIKKALSAQ